MQTAATTGLALAVAAGGDDAERVGVVAEGDAAGGPVATDGEVAPQPTRTIRPADTSPRSGTLPRGVFAFTAEPPFISAAALRAVNLGTLGGHRLVAVCPSSPASPARTWSVDPAWWKRLALPTLMQPEGDPVGSRPRTRAGRPIVWRRVIRC